MQPELLPTPQTDETEERLKARVEKLYRIYGQDWRPFFEQKESNPSEDADPFPLWLLRRAREESALTKAGR